MLMASRLRKIRFLFWERGFLWGSIIAAALFLNVYIFSPVFFPLIYERPVLASNEVTLKKEVTHVETPVAVKAIYMTSWTAGSPKMREKLVRIAENTEINSVVIDVKDYTGRVAFSVSDPFLKKIGSEEKRISDIGSFIKELHDKNIYVIGRISVFQDSYMVKSRPDLAVKRKSDNNIVWKDYKGISWLDPNSREVWSYIAAIGHEAWNVGFDELNFDYIRFPSDGNVADLYYPWGNGDSKALTLKKFFAFIKKQFRETDAKLSADLFGMTMTNEDDLNIGQVLENALPYFDYVAPMVYPSHYPPYFNGYKNPAAKPYEVVKFSMDKGVVRASTTPLKLRPWLQDFNLGAAYTPEMVRAEIQAVYDSGLTSWMLWSPSNRYTEAALLKE